MNKSFVIERGRYRLYYTPWYGQWAIQEDGGIAVSLFESFKKARKKFDKLTA